MTLQELRYLVAVADSRHFARAAEACHVSQPTLSTGIKKLETNLGVALLDRSQSKVRPTPLGERVVAQARVVLEEAEKIMTIVRSQGGPLEGPFRLGVIPTLGPYLIPHLLPTIRAELPDLRLFLREDYTANLVEQLTTGDLDAALLALPVIADEIATTQLFKETFMVALPLGHTLAKRKRVRQQDLNNEGLLLLEEGHCLRDQALEICGGGFSTANEEVRATSLETLRQMVAAGIGCTLLPALAISPMHTYGSAQLLELRSFVPPVPFRTIGLATRKRYPRPEIVQALGNIIRGLGKVLL